MLVSEMITQLTRLQADVGDVKVLITDGFACRCYQGAYVLQTWTEDSGEVCVDIGIGGCEEE